MQKHFATFAHLVAQCAGHPFAFAAAALVVIAWACAGPFFDYGQGWQLLINTGTTIVTFLMVFVLQNSQTRDTIAMHAKLDELVRATDAADNTLRRAEAMTAPEIEALRERKEHEAENNPPGRAG